MFERKCPKCNKELSYRRIYEMKRAEKHFSVCRSCNSKEIATRIEVYTKKSKAVMGDNNPSKRLEIRVKNKQYHNRPEVRCAKSKRMVGENNPMKILENRIKICGKNNPNWRPRGKEYTKWQEYKLDVWRITKQQPLHLLENFDKRGFRQYHIDHIISVSVGFERNIPAEAIGNIKNLQMLWWRKNLQKSRNGV